jgi:pyruvate formate lyase activating enzyme
MPVNALQVGGFTPITTIDYPDHLSAVIFCQGCALRCHYCHNRQLLPRRTNHLIPWSKITDFLTRRRGLLDGVVFSGGEPTLQVSIEHAVEEIKSMGFLIGLHTAGTYPERFARLLPRIDWVGLDIKALAKDYPALTGVEHAGESAWRAARLLVNSGIPHEIRTTLFPVIDNPHYRKRLERELNALGRINHKWQTARQPAEEKTFPQVNFY